MNTGSITIGTSFTSVIAPVVWKSTFTTRTCSQGIGMFSSNFNMACGMNLNLVSLLRSYFNAPR